MKSKEIKGRVQHTLGHGRERNESHGHTRVREVRESNRWANNLTIRIFFKKIDGPGLI